MNRTIKAIIAVIDKASAPLRAIQQRAGEVFKPLRRTAFLIGSFARNSGLTALYGGFKNVGRAVVDLGGKVRSLFGPLSAITGVLTVAGFARMVRGFAEMADATLKAAERIGGSVEAFQELRYAAKTGGVEAEAFGNGMEKLNENIAKAAAGKNKDLSALFKKLGIEVKTADGRLRSATELLPELAEAFRQNEDPALRTRMAIALMGEAGVDMIPWLARGADEMDRMRKRARDLGLVLSDEKLKAGADLADSLTDLGLAADALGNSISSELAPEVRPLVDDMIEWVKANRDLIAQDVKRAFRGLVDTFRSIDWKAVWEALKGIGKAIGSIVEVFGGWDVVIAGLGVIMVAKPFLDVGAAILGLGGALKDLAGIIAGNPILATLAGVGFLASQIFKTDEAGDTPLQAMVRKMGERKRDSLAAPAAAAANAAGGAVTVPGLTDGGGFDDGTDFGDAGAPSAPRPQVLRSNRMTDLAAAIAQAVTAREQTVKLDGEVKTSIRFLNAPPLEATTKSSGPVSTDLDTGLSGLAYGS